MHRILVIDDDKDILKIVKKVLEANGYEATCLDEPLDAVELLKTEIFDLILCDANMPQVSGFDLVRTIRASYHIPNVSIAMLTARRDRRDVQRALECGADDYIVKPVDPDTLLSKVESLVQQRDKEHKKTVSFAESSVRMNAQWEVPSEIVRVSEQGLTLWSAICSAPKSKVRVKSRLFELIGVEAPTLRVVECTPDALTPSYFFTQTTFVGLTEQELQKIRAYVNTHTRKNEKAA